MSASSSAIHSRVRLRFCWVKLPGTLVPTRISAVSGGNQGLGLSREASEWSARRTGTGQVSLLSRAAQLSNRSFDLDGSKPSWAKIADQVVGTSARRLRTFAVRSNLRVTQFRGLKPGGAAMLLHFMTFKKAKD